MRCGMIMMKTKCHKNFHFINLSVDNSHLKVAVYSAADDKMTLYRTNSLRNTD